MSFLDFVVVGLGVGLVVVIDFGCGFLGFWWWISWIWWWWMVADLGFVIRLWWVMAGKRCVWLVGVVLVEGVLVWWWQRLCI